MLVPYSLAPELKVLPQLFSEHSQRSNHSCLSGFCLNSVFTQPVTFYLRHIIEFQVSKFYGLLFCRSMLFSPGEGWGLAFTYAFSWAPAKEQLHHREVVLSLWQHKAKSLCQDSQSSASFPTLMPGKSAAHRQPHSSCNHEYPETMLHHLGFHLTLPLEL